MAKTVYTKDEILAILPHREPFLFVDRITRFRADKMIEAEYTLPIDHPILAGHFPDFPLMPGVLMTDACAQVSGLLWGFTQQVTLPPEEQSDEPEIFFLAQENMKYLKPVKPGTTLTICATKKEAFGDLYRYAVQVLVGSSTVAKGQLTLAIKERSELS